MLSQLPNEKRFLEIILSLMHATTNFYALYLKCSTLDMHTLTSSKIKVNELIEYFKFYKGYLFVAANKDIIIIFNDQNDIFVKECRREIIERIFDDEMIGGKPIEGISFIDHFVLSQQWEEFYALCREKVSKQHEGTIMTSRLLMEIEDTMTNIDLSHVMRYQAVSSVNDAKITPVLNELYVNIAHLKKLLLKDVDLVGNKALFRCLTLTLDKHMLKLLTLRPTLLPKDTAISLNLNVETLLTGDFTKFNDFVKANLKQAFVIEIDIGNVFTDINAFIKAKDHAQSLGYRICLDGLNTLSFIQIDRESLGFDLIKLQWNKIIAEKLNSNEHNKLLEAIRKCGSNRMILCWCDDQTAIDYGKQLGIQLFQGRHIDKLLHPTSKIVN